MNAKKELTYSGFTIIEVSLVLAIAGLIFLMVFIALPGLRASQRDTSRRESVMSLVDSVKQYQKNNRGALPRLVTGTSVDVTWAEAQAESTNPATWAGFFRDYLGESFVDPNGEHYQLRVVQCSGMVNSECPDTDLNNATFPNDYRMLIVLQSSCYGDKAVATSNPRKLSVLYKLEGAGVYCSNT